MLHAVLACMIPIFHARGRGHEQYATFRARLRLTYPARRAIVERILVGLEGFEGVVRTQWLVYNGLVRFRASSLGE